MDRQKYNERRRLKYKTDDEHQKKEKERSVENHYKKMGYSYEERQQQLLIPKLYINKDRYRIKWKNQLNGKWDEKQFIFINKGRDKTLEKVLEYINKNFNGNYIDKTN